VAFLVSCARSSTLKGQQLLLVEGTKHSPAEVDGGVHLASTACALVLCHGNLLCVGDTLTEHKAIFVRMAFFRPVVSSEPCRQRGSFTNGRCST